VCSLRQKHTRLPTARVHLRSNHTNTNLVTAPGAVTADQQLRSHHADRTNLQSGRSTQHPELCAFASWAEVQDYVEQDEAGADLAVFVRLVEQHGAGELIRAANHLVDERVAELTISTAHKAKGREWRRVQIAGDFKQPKADEEGRPGKLPRAEAMLAYVSVTRAQHVLDRGGLSWIDDHLAGVPGPKRSQRRMTDDSSAFWA
jgi:hypothetical protein